MILVLCFIFLLSALFIVYKPIELYNDTHNQMFLFCIDHRYYLFSINMSILIHNSSQKIVSIWFPFLNLSFIKQPDIFKDFDESNWNY